MNLKEKFTRKIKICNAVVTGETLKKYFSGNILYIKVIVY